MVPVILVIRRALAEGACIARKEIRVPGDTGPRNGTGKSESTVGGRLLTVFMYEKMYCPPKAKLWLCRTKVMSSAIWYFTVLK